MEEDVREQAERHGVVPSPEIMDTAYEYPPQPSFTLDMQQLKVGWRNLKPVMKPYSAWFIQALAVFFFFYELMSIEPQGTHIVSNNQAPPPFEAGRLQVRVELLSICFQVQLAPLHLGAAGGGRA